TRASLCGDGHRVKSGLRVERDLPDGGQRVVVDQHTSLAGEEGAISGNVDVVKRLDRTRLDGNHPHGASEGAQHVAWVEVAGLRPAASSSPESVIYARQQDHVVTQGDSKRSIR